MRQARRFVKWMRGGSRPALFGVRDGSLWVVKYQNNQQGCRVLVNEWVNYHLAQLLELPTPRADLVDVPHDLVMVSELRHHDDEYIAPGTSFGSQYIETADNWPLDYQMARLVNPWVIPGVVIMDTWVDNYDHNTNQSNLLTSPSTAIPGRFVYHLIDLGTITTHNWTIRHLEERRDIFQRHQHNPHFAKYLAQPNAISEYLDRLEAIPCSSIESIVASVPAEWGLNQADGDALVRFLEHRKTQLRSLFRRDS